MTYERRKKFVLEYLVYGGYQTGLSIVEASRGLLRKKTLYQTLERMESERLIVGQGTGRAWERQYSRARPWENN